MNPNILLLSLGACFVFLLLFRYRQRAEEIKLQHRVKVWTKQECDVLVARANAWERTDKRNEAMRCRPCPRTYEPIENL